MSSLTHIGYHLHASISDKDIQHTFHLHTFRNKKELGIYFSDSQFIRSSYVPPSSHLTPSGENPRILTTVPKTYVTTASSFPHDIGQTLPKILSNVSWFLGQSLCFRSIKPKYLAILSIIKYALLELNQYSAICLSAAVYVIYTLYLTLLLRLCVL